MPFIPNAADAFHESQASPDSGHFETLRAGSKATGVVSGGAVTAQGTPDMTVAVEAAVIAWEGARANVTAGNLTLTADGTDPRFYLIVASSAGVKSAVAGTPAPEMDSPTEPGPVFPAIPDESVVLASVYVPAADTDIDANQIDDMRVFVVPPEPTTNYDLAKARSVPLVTERGEVVTLGAGQNQIHGSAMANGKLFFTTRTAPAYFIRCNDLDDLTDRTAFQFAADGLHDNANACVYVAEAGGDGVGRIYVLFNHATRVQVTEVNPSTHATVDVINDTGNAAGTVNGGGICSDGTHLYVVTDVALAKVLKYRLSDFVLVGSVTLTKANGHAAMFDGVDVFATGIASPAWIARINTSAMTAVEADLPTGFGSATDDMASIGDYVWVGTESGTGIFRIEKATLTSQTQLFTSVTGAIYGLHFDGQYLWAVTVSGILARIDPESGDVATLTFSDASPNEILSDGAGRLFISHFLSPSKIRRVFAPALSATRSLLPFTTPAGGSSAATTPIGVKFIDNGTRSAGASEVALTSAGIEANTLNVTKRGVRLKARGRFAATANTKRVKVRLGATDLYDTGLFAFDGTKWTLEFELFRTGASTQDWAAEFRSEDALLPLDLEFGTATADETIVNILATRAIGGAAADVQQELFVLEMLN